MKQTLTIPRKATKPASTKVIGDAFKRWTENQDLTELEIEVTSGDHSTKVRLVRP